MVSGNLKIFELLLKKGGLDPTMRTKKNETLLHVAAQLGMAEFIPVLLKCGIEPKTEDVGKKSALDRYVLTERELEIA